MDINKDEDSEEEKRERRERRSHQQKNVHSWMSTHHAKYKALCIFGHARSHFDLGRFNSLDASDYLLAGASNIISLYSATCSLCQT